MLSCRQNLASRRRRGFSLLEMMVVGIVGVVMLGVIGNTWRWYLHSVHDIRVVTQLTREVKLAAEAIAQDFGPSLAARTVDGTQVQIDTDADDDGVAQWAAPDSVVEYLVQSNQLVRRDVISGTTLPMAAHISEVTAETVGGKFQVHLTASLRGTDQDLTLQLEGS